ncbi:MAG: DUF4214 domain-containing protein [Lachnospiraceae bacterium]
MKKCIAMFLCLAMVFSLLPAISVKAEGTNNIYIASSEFDKADVYYSINNGSENNFSTVSQNGTNKVITGVTVGSTVKIKIEPKNNRNIEVKVKEGPMGAGNGSEAGNWDSSTQTYIFTTSEGGGTPRDYLIKLEENNNNSPGNGSWEDQYTQYLAPGINILSQWIGNSVGDISYSFSATNGENSYTAPVTLDRSTVESCLSNVTDANKSTLFGIPTEKYVKIKTGRDLGGNHLGFEIYKKDNQGKLQRDDDALSLLKYWSYHDKRWKDFSDPTNREWEDYLKNSEAYDPDVQHDVPIDGLILDISGLDMNTYAIRCLFPFDSRKNVSWWNAKYKGEVAAAGDQVSDDSWVENGTVELVKVTSEDGSQVYYSDEPGWTADPNLDANMVVKIAKAGYDMGSDQLRPGYDGPHGEYTAEQMLEAAEKASGQCNIPVNAIATVMLTPDPGYQILAATLNGMPLTPDAGTQSKFSFQITSNIHFQALFEEAADVVDVGDAQEVTSATIGGTADVVDSGNLALTVKDDAGYDDTKALAVVDGEAVASLNIEVDQIIAKAGNLSEEEQAQAKEGKLEVTEEKFWKNNLTDLNNPVDIELVLNDVTVEDNEELALVRDHNGEYQEIPLDVNVQGGQTVASFSSEKFSTYTIIKKSEKNIKDDFMQTISREDAENFVSRMYSIALGRNFDDEGLDYWCDKLVDQKIDAAGITYQFFASKEYQAKDRTNEEYLDDLYQTILGRTPDAEGKAYWLKALQEGQSRTVVMSCFVNSNEFTDICDEFNIPRGTMERDGSSICNADVRHFVLRNYAKALERKGETAGVETWCYLINSKKMTPAEVTESFFHSKEFINKKLSDEEYVETLYETFLGRSSDPEGKAYWLNHLKKGQSRDEVMKGFSNSAEFSKIVAGFGL